MGRFRQMLQVRPGYGCLDRKRSNKRESALNGAKVQYKSRESPVGEIGRLKIIDWDGGHIQQPGIYAGIPIDIYHSRTICGDEPSVSSSILRKLFTRSAAHYWAYSPYNSDGKSSEDEDTEALILGRAAHHALLGERYFSDRYIIRPEKLIGANGFKPWHGNRDACKEWMKRNAHLTVLSPSEAEQITGMAAALARHPLVIEGALNGYVECSMFWRDQRTGIWLKARPDVIPSDAGLYVDIKKTRSVEYFALQATLDDYGYYMQAALIFEGATQLKLPTEQFTFLFFENDYPHLVRDVTLSAEDIALGAEVNISMLEKFARCWRTGEWPGHANGIGGSIELSERSRERIRRRLEYEKADAGLSTLCAEQKTNADLLRSRLQGQNGEGFPGADAVTAEIDAARTRS